MEAFKPPRLYIYPFKICIFKIYIYIQEIYFKYIFSRNIYLENLTRLENGMCVLINYFSWLGIVILLKWTCCSSLFSRKVTSNSLWPYGLQHTRLPCPSLSPRVCSNSCPLSQWCHPTITSSIISFSSCPQSFPATGSFPVSRSLHQVLKVLELHLQHQFFQWIFRVDFL